MPKYTKAQKAAYAKRMRGKKKKAPRGNIAKSRARASLVECKKHQAAHPQLELTNSLISVWPEVRTFLNMQQGIGESQFIGNSIFSKYLSMKLQFNFPQEEFAVTGQYRIKLVHGWMTAPLAYSQAPLNPYVPDRDTCTEVEIYNTITSRCLPGFDNLDDVMKFRDKEKKIYRIEGSQWIKPNRANQIGHPQSSAVIVDGMEASDYIVGGPPKVLKQLHWKPMRKVRYTPTTGGAGGTPFHYPNESWLPFVAIFTPDHNNLVNNASPLEPPTSAYFPKVQISSCHWYTDS